MSWADRMREADYDIGVHELAKMRSDGAALLPRHASVEDAVSKAKRYITNAIGESGQLDVGHGHGPVHRFHALWPEHREVRQTT